MKSDFKFNIGDILDLLPAHLISKSFAPSPAQIKIVGYLVIDGGYYHIEIINPSNSVCNDYYRKEFTELWYTINGNYSLFKQIKKLESN
jgi:hypothetical protein